MKRNYENPSVELVLMEMDDVIVTSGLDEVETVPDTDITDGLL